MELKMVYLYIVLLVIIAFLILEREKFFGSVGKKSDYTNDESNTQLKLTQCAKCGIYISKNESLRKNGKDYCASCIN